MGNDPDDVDPDAATVMPVGRREPPVKGGAKVLLEVGGDTIDARLVSVSGREVVVQAPRALAVDSGVTLTAAAGKPQTKALVVWTRSQGTSVAVGLALPDDAAAKPWSKLLG